MSPQRLAAPTGTGQVMGNHEPGPLGGKRFPTRFVPSSRSAARAHLNGTAAAQRMRLHPAISGFGAVCDCKALTLYYCFAGDPYFLPRPARYIQRYRPTACRAVAGALL